MTTVHVYSSVYVSGRAYNSEFLLVYVYVLYLVYLCWSRSPYGEVNEGFDIGREEGKGGPFCGRQFEHLKHF